MAKRSTLKNLEKRLADLEERVEGISLHIDSSLERKKPVLVGIKHSYSEVLIYLDRNRIPHNVIRGSKFIRIPNYAVEHLLNLGISFSIAPYGSNDYRRTV